MRGLIRTLLAALALLLPTLSLSANWGSCFCFDLCGGGPLCCGGLSVMAKGGVTPSSYTHRGNVWLTIPALAPDPIIISPIHVTRFSDQFSVPWNVGAEIAWNASKRIQFFLEYAYTQAEGKLFSFDSTPFQTTFVISEKYTNYQTHGGYLGARYYFEGCCFPCLGRIAPYIGFKAGFAVQKGVFYTLGVNGVDAATPLYFKSQTAVSTGVQLGLEWWFYRCFSVALQGEFVATQGPRPNRNAVLDPPAGGVTNINIGSTGWLIGWPVTLGLRYNF